jgi:hypothetical protein
MAGIHITLSAAVPTQTDATHDGVIYLDQGWLQAAGIDRADPGGPRRGRVCYRTAKYPLPRYILRSDSPL